MQPIPSSTSAAVLSPSDILAVAIENGIVVEEEVVATSKGFQESGLGEEELQQDEDDDGAKEMVGYQKEILFY